MSKQPSIVVIAIASRSYVQMAVTAGYRVVAIDAFADADLIKISDETYQLSLENGGFEIDALRECLNQLNWDGVVCIAYGAGFEARPEHLALLAEYASLIGNTAATVSACKALPQFVDFCDTHQFLYPPIAKTQPSKPEGWLVKTANGSGGAHIQFSTSTIQLTTGQYYQQFQAGTPVSCLFLANGQDATIVGINEQWCEASEQSPFRYGGVASHFIVSEDVRQQIQHFVTQASKAFHLVGLNSCDAILQDEQLYFLEINPRLSASAALYEDAKGDLFEYHRLACQQKTLPELDILPSTRAHQVKYASHDCSVIATEQWPEWVSDRPINKQTVVSNAPMFTVHGSAKSSHQAKELVKTRAASIC